MSEQERLAACGVDTEAALERFAGDEELYGSCLRLFLKDPAFSALARAMECGDSAAAFAAAHTLKGVAGNLGLSSLCAVLSRLTEPLRSGDFEEARVRYGALPPARAELAALIGPEAL